MLIIVAFRNLIELSGSEFNFTEGFSLPKSFGWFRGNNVLWTISYVRTLFVIVAQKKHDAHLLSVVAGLDSDDL
jgi:hypothetical protein